MPAYIVTPWRSQADLLTVRQQLYRLDGEDNRRHAVDRIMAWRLRGNLPHAVESTALLIDAFLHHDITANSSFSIRAVYSAAFCRFVTGFCDIGRNRERSLEPSSMLEIARQIDMPADFVSLRHEATHEELPAEQRIVAACEGALQWLWRVYWSRLDMPTNLTESRANSDSTEHNDACKAFAHKMFKTYRSAKRDSLKKRERPEVLQNRLAESIDAFGRLCANDAVVLKVVADDIVKKDLLIPSDRQQGDALQGAFLVWDNLLQDMATSQQQFMPALTTAMLAVIDNEDHTDDGARQEAYALWLTHICCSVEWENLLQASLADIRRSAMRSFVTHPNAWTSKVAEALVAAGDEMFAKGWKPVIDAAFGTDDAEQDSNSADEVQAARVEASPAGWHRAVLPPTTPFGVVA